MTRAVIISIHGRSKTHNHFSPNHVFVKLWQGDMMTNASHKYIQDKERDQEVVDD